MDRWGVGRCLQGIGTSRKKTHTKDHMFNGRYGHPTWTPPIWVAPALCPAICRLAIFACCNFLCLRCNLQGGRLEDVADTDTMDAERHLDKGLPGTGWSVFGSFCKLLASCKLMQGQDVATVRMYVYTCRRILGPEGAAMSLQLISEHLLHAPTL